MYMHELIWYACCFYLNLLLVETVQYKVGLIILCALPFLHIHDHEMQILCDFVHINNKKYCR